MADSKRVTSLARVRSGQRITLGGPAQPATGHAVSLRESNRLARAERSRFNRRVAACLAVLAALAFVSLGIMGAQGRTYLGSHEYAFYNPAQVAYALYLHAYNAIATSTHLFSAYSSQWLTDNVPGYWAVISRAGVIGITIVCAVLLSTSGMLYQNVFRNPLAGPGMLGVSTGVGLGVMILVLLYGGAAQAMVGQRYALCYGLGAAILAAVMLGGRKLSGPRGTDVVSLLLVGSIFSQMLGFIVSYVTLFVMDDTDYATYFEVSQMLTVDTSALSWICLGIAALVSIVPIFLLRFQMNSLAFPDDEVRVLGLSGQRLRVVALLCGGIMILAAQVHTGMVGMVSLIVPFLSRSWFGCEFSKQFTGNVCISTVLLLACRDIADLVPFVGDGLAVGSVVGLVALPLFLAVVYRQQRNWE